MNSAMDGYAALRKRNSRSRRGLGFGGLLFVGLLVYGVIVLINPWAFHIGDRWTPLLYWTGSGQLVTKSGTYPLFVTMYPSRHSSTLRLDGLRPTGGLNGTGSLCTARGVMVPLELTGTIYDGWRSTDGSLVDFRLLERRGPFDAKPRGYFNLYGHWHGPELAMQDRGQYAHTFRSGLKIENASVKFTWASYSDFKAGCAATTNSVASR